MISFQKYSINLASDIFKSVFGYRALPFPAYADKQATRLVPNPKNVLSAYGATLKEPDKYGTAFCPVKISKLVNGLPVKTYNLQYSTVSVSCKKTIVETPLIGRQGTVNELIQIGDYEFVINGIILHDNYNTWLNTIEGESIDSSESELPQFEIANLRDVFKINEPVSLESAFTEIFLDNANECIVKNIYFPDMKGISNAQAYTIELKSDSVLELEML